MPMLALRAATTSTLLAALALATTATFAADPPSGTLTTTTTSLTFATGPFDDSNLGDCTAGGCDDFALTVQVPSDYAQQFPGATLEVDLVYTLPGDLDLELLSSSGTSLDTSGEPAGLPEHMEIPVQNGTNAYTVRVIPFAVAGTTATVTVSLQVPVPPPPPHPPSGLPPRHQVHVSPPSLGNDAGEPSVGFDKLTGNAMFIAYTQALRVSFRENQSPALPMACDAEWLDKSGFITTLNTLDPILFTDEATGRTFNSQLSGANSLFEFSDDDGETWTPGQVGVPNGGADHQTVASGPYPIGGTPSGATWPATGPKRAVYYCSQSVAGAFCSRSDDGGATFGPGFLVKNPECSVGALHGHVKVAWDGTVYVPDASQCLLPVGGSAEKVVAFVSGDAGQTWAVRPVPASQGGAASDPSIGLATDGTVYMCYENADSHVHVAVSHDKGLTWENDQDIGAALGIAYTRFPQSVAGDPDRAACAFLGTTTSAGDPNSLEFEGVWYPYVATTFDGGVSWHVVNVSPNDPVQGYGGVGPDGTNRNLLDFNDLQLDDQGRTLFAYADGCVGGCVVDPAANSFAAKATLVRQTGGRSLYRQFDDAAGSRYNSTTPIAPAPACAVRERSLRTIAQARVAWNAPDTGGSPVTNYVVQRSYAAAGPFTTIGNAGTATTYIDATASPTEAEAYYRVVAENAVGAAPVSNTILLPIEAAPPAVDTCTLPGEVIITDTVGDGTADDTDIVWVAVAEPEDTPDVFVITEKIANFSAGTPPATAFYPILFPTRGSSYVAVDAGTGVPRFVYGTYETLPQGVLAFTEAGTLDPASSVAADGTMRLVVPRSFFGDPAPGAVIAGFDARARIGAPSATSRDTAGPGDYTVRGTAICAAQAPTVAKLDASTNQGEVPLAVTFTRTGEVADGRTLASWTLVFGDGEALTDQPFGAQTTVQVSHTYDDVGAFRAKLTVKDDAGNVSNEVEQTIEVSPQDAMFANGYE
ncbi:MAG TPA: PKD domain-containing protein [Xanthomonadales bacterium]|nr:PKD domain-containing protein [Xanthomonadales bacterium]